MVVPTSTTNTMTSVSTVSDRGTEGVSQPRQTSPRLSGRHVRPHGADVPEPVARVGEARDLHDIAGVRRLDELVVADVDPFVLRPERRVLVEEDEIAGPQLIAGEPQAFVVLRAGVVGQADAQLLVDVHREAG